MVSGGLVLPEAASAAPAGLEGSWWSVALEAGEVSGTLPVTCPEGLLHRELGSVYSRCVAHRTVLNFPSELLVHPLRSERAGEKPWASASAGLAWGAGNAPCVGRGPWQSPQPHVRAGDKTLASGMERGRFPVGEDVPWASGKDTPWRPCSKGQTLLGGWGEPPGRLRCPGQTLVWGAQGTSEL